MSSLCNPNKATVESNSLVYGFCRDIYKSFPSNITYYSIQPAIVDICISFYFINLKLSDRVKLNDGKTGIIRYIGYPSFVNYELIGIELDEWSPNATNGIVKGEQIFSVQGNRGYFTRRQLIEDVNPLFFEVGDRIELLDGKTGVVRYIGQPQFADEELVGIELDKWSAEAGNGSAQGQQLFSTSQGRGYFARRKSIANVVHSKITEGAFARLKGLIRIPKFNGKTVRIVAYVEKKGRWKVKLLHAKQEKKYLGVREENLDVILDWEPITTPIQKSLTKLPEIGDRVKSRQGRYGIVKYCAQVEFSMSNEVHIGLELESKDTNGHNGTVKNKKYYEARDGYGYFVKLQDLVENLGPSRTQSDGNQSTNIKPNIGDHVKTKSGICGVVKYYGNVEFSPVEYIGLELEEWDPNGHNGTVYEKRYYQTNDGYGYFVRFDSLEEILKRCDVE